MKRTVELIFERKKLVILLFCLVLGYGIYSFIVIPKQEMPELDTPYMVVSVTAPSIVASDMEDEVIGDIEKVIMTFDEVSEINTTLYDNFAYIIISFKYSVPNPKELSIDVFDKINELSFSDNITDISFTSNFDDPHIIYAIHSDVISESELKKIASNFRNQLILVDEIKTVKIDSVANQEVVITLDSNLLTLYSLDITTVKNVLLANSIDVPLGGIDTEFGTISVTGDAQISTLEELESMIILPKIDGVADEVTLNDISTIEIKDTSNKIYSFNDDGTVFLSVYFNNNIDFTKMGSEIRNIKNDFIKLENNNDLSIDEMLFLPDYVNNQINDIFFSLLLAVGVVLVIVLIGIGFRNSMLIIITIPLIIFGTIGILYLTNFELHKMTIVGLIVAIGILVDNSIVITEGIKRNIDNGMDKIEGAKLAIRENSIPVLSSTLTTIAAFIVIVLLPGFLGKIVASMPLTVIIAISLSYIVSMVLSPVLATLFLKKTVKKKDKTSIHEKNIKRMIGYTIKFPAIWILCSLAFLFITVFISFKTLPLDLYPNDERSVLYIDFENKELGNIYSTVDIGTKITDIIKTNEHVLNYSMSIGGDLPSFHFSANLISEISHQGRIYINFDYNENDLLAYQKELESNFKEITTAKISVNTLELSPPVPDLRVTLKGNNPVEIDILANELFTEISELDSLKAYTAKTNITSKKLLVSYDSTSISNSYLTKAQVAEFIAYNINGYDFDISKYNENYINVSINSDITSVEQLLSLEIYSETLDNHIPLYSLITVQETTGYVVINRQNNKDMASIDLYYSDESNLNELSKDVKEIVKNHNTNNIKVTYSGENSMFEEISGDLVKAGIIAIILIYIIMFIQFNNFVKPLIVYSTIPLSFAGSFLFLLIFKTPITATALIGMVSLIGVTVNNGILLVEYISRRDNEGMNVKEACINSVFLRFRPIILTSATTILGLIPLLLTGGNFFRPLAITFMGGMISSTILTIFLVPSVYYMIYKKRHSH